MSGERKDTIYCNFCGKSQHEVSKIIAGPCVFICNECVELCADICDNARAENIAKKLITKALQFRISVKRVMSARFWGGVDG